jgi:hypothetical protein
VGRQLVKQQPDTQLLLSLLRCHLVCNQKLPNKEEEGGERRGCFVSPRYRKWEISAEFTQKSSKCARLNPLLSSTSPPNSRIISSKRTLHLMSAERVLMLLFVRVKKELEKEKSAFDERGSYRSARGAPPQGKKFPVMARAFADLRRPRAPQGFFLRVGKFHFWYFEPNTGVRENSR